MADVPESEPIDGDPSLLEIDDLDAVAGGRGPAPGGPDGDARSGPASPL